MCLSVKSEAVKHSDDDSWNHKQTSPPRPKNAASQQLRHLSSITSRREKFILLFDRVLTPFLSCRRRAVSVAAPCLRLRAAGLDFPVSHTYFSESASVPRWNTRRAGESIISRYRKHIPHPSTTSAQEPLNSPPEIVSISLSRQRRPLEPHLLFAAVHALLSRPCQFLTSTVVPGPTCGPDSRLETPWRTHRSRRSSGYARDLTQFRTGRRGGSEASLSPGGASLVSRAQRLAASQSLSTGGAGRSV